MQVSEQRTPEGTAPADFVARGPREVRDNARRRHHLSLCEHGSSRRRRESGSRGKLTGATGAGST